MGKWRSYRYEKTFTFRLKSAPRRARVPSVWRSIWKPTALPNGLTSTGPRHRDHYWEETPNRRAWKTGMPQAPPVTVALTVIWMITMGEKVKGMVVILPLQMNSLSMDRMAIQCKHWRVISLEPVINEQTQVRLSASPINDDWLAVKRFTVPLTFLRFVPSKIPAITKSIRYSSCLVSLKACYLTELAGVVTGWLPADNLPLLFSDVARCPCMSSANSLWSGAPFKVFLECSITSPDIS